jgi:hypothetical protein
MTVTVNASTVPTFTQVAAICAGGSITLPTTSNNGINGTWAPAINNQSTTTYTFTPSSGSCVTTATMTVTVNPTSNSAVTQTACGSYTWNGTTYTTSGDYTHSNGSCSVDTLHLTITPSVTPAFTQVAAICAGGSFSLPSSSNNGITGTWSPAINNQATTTYTFTPDAAQCAVSTTMTVTVNASLNPSFTQVAAICAGGSFTLPTTSSNGVSGSWSPAVNNQTTTTYTFTPTAGQCAITATMTVTVNPSTTPTFTQVAAICAGDNFSLPSSSINGVAGTWSPAVNNQTTTTYTFTPSAGQCATTATMTVTVNASTTPTFTQVAPIFVGGTFTLPTTSNNGVNGTWSPAINNQATTTYTFTPAAGQCASSTSMIVTVNPIPTTSAVIYPNPTTDGIVTVNWSNAKIQNNRIVMVTVFDNAGRVVYKNDNLSSGSGITTNLDLGIKKYSNGVYFVKIEAADNSVIFTTKIVLARK